MGNSSNELSDLLDQMEVFKVSRNIPWLMTTQLVFENEEHFNPTLKTFDIEWHRTIEIAGRFIKKIN